MFLRFWPPDAYGALEVTFADTRPGPGSSAQGSLAVALNDDLLPNESQVAESGAQRGEVSAELIEAQLTAGSVEDVVLGEVGAECGVVLTGDRLIADAGQIAGPVGCQR